MQRCAGQESLFHARLPPRRGHQAHIDSHNPAGGQPQPDFGCPSCIMACFLLPGVEGFYSARYTVLLPAWPVNCIQRIQAKCSRKQDLRASLMLPFAPLLMVSAPPAQVALWSCGPLLARAGSPVKPPSALSQGQLLALCASSWTALGPVPRCMCQGSLFRGPSCGRCYVFHHERPLVAVVLRVHYAVHAVVMSVNLPISGRMPVKHHRIQQVL
jgi:hypothetical protein